MLNPYRTTALVSLLLALIAAPAAGQTEAPRGTVVDAITGEPVVGANIVSGPGAAITDSLGAFELTAGGDSLTVSHIGYEPATVPAAAAAIVRLQPAVLSVPEVVVRAGLSEQALADVAASVSVLGQDEIRATHGAHLDALIGAVPNLNWAGGTSRPRYFQIRGMGERSHYAGEGPPNFAVGFVLDDVDLSGLGSAGLLFDLDQVEVFRGPQSTIFGPNSMAGLISLRSAAPARALDGRLSTTAGTDATLRLDGSVNVPVSENLALRLGYAANRADGFRTNEHLGRHDTNRRRESVVRLKAQYAGHDGTRLTGTAFRADLDNGYDAWAPNNNEDLHTYSDRPGADSQVTTGLSLRAEVPVEPVGADLVSITAYSRTEAEHSYDGDWGNDSFWADAPYGFDPESEGWRYDFFDRTLRERTTFTQELRLLRADAIAAGDEAVVGAYAKVLREEDDASGYLFGGDATDLASTFDVRDLAVYGQYSLGLTEDFRLSLNLRADRNRTEYEGLTNDGAEEVRFDVADWLAGGKVAVHYRLAESRVLYAAASRGYIAGGVNQHPRLADASRPFDPEYVTNYEVGYRASGTRHTTSLTLFHTLRSDQQVDLSSQQTPGDPNSFVYYIANASSGRSSGLELEHTQRLTRAVRLFGSLGLLSSHVDAYTFSTGVGEPLTLGGRGAAHAPAHTYRLGAECGRQAGPFGRLEASGADGFYFSQSHDERADAHQLLHAQVGYRGEDWSVTLWGRNLLDERYAVRGFNFGLEPPDYPARLYVTHGDPRHLGVTVTVEI